MKKLRVELTAITIKKDIFGVYGSGFENDDISNPLSVLEAKRVHGGKVYRLRDDSDDFGDVCFRS